MTATALIIDDEPDIRELIAITLTRMGWDFHAAASLEEARNLLGLHPFDLCLTDMRLPDGNGVDFVKYAQKNKPHIPIAVITAHGNMEAAVDAMKNGAYDFVSKPVDISQLRQLVTQAVAMNKAPANAANEAENSASTSDQYSEAESNNNFATRPTPQAISAQPANPSADTTSDNPNSLLMGDSPLMQELHGLIRNVSRTTAPIWITGEAGTGKAVIARSIHEQGPHSAEPFITVNCRAIPSHQIESELFGHKKGSFAGATSDQDGLFVQANGGTLFLDEVEALPLQIQIKLLQAIQQRSVRPVGGREDQLANVRILSASHANLASEVEAGRFRHDLYYRLNVISLRVPSLRERSDEVDADVNSQTAAVNTKQSDDGEYTRIVNALNKTHWNRKAAAEMLGLTYRQLRYRIKQFDIDKAP